MAAPNSVRKGLMTMHAPLMGTYYHNMDAKGRMAFPNKLREQLGVNFVITIGLEGCLYVAEADKQGRILIPQNLREHAGLDHDITVIGNLNRAEIWDTARYNEINSKFTDEELAEAIDSLAF